MRTAEAGHHAVGDHGDHGDAEPRHDAAPDIGLGERDVNLLPEIARADQRRDDQHRDRQHDRLVHAEHDFRQRQRQPHLGQELSSCRAHRLRRLDQRRVDLANAERRVADRRRDGVEDDGDHGGEIADPEEHDDRDQVDEGRQRLQRVDDRLHDAPDAAVEPRGDADRDADQRRDEHRHADEIDRHHRRLPIAGEDDEECEGAGDHGAPCARDLPASDRHERDRPRPGLRQHEALHRQEDVQEHRRLHRLERVEEVDVQPFDQRVPELRRRDLQRRGIGPYGGHGEPEQPEQERRAECRQRQRIALHEGAPAHVPDPARAERIGLADPVERHGQHDDGDARPPAPCRC